jgi:hypothetical protein
MSPRAPQLTFRATDEDKEIIAWLQEKLGISAADVIRLGIRALQRQEQRKDK